MHDKNIRPLLQFLHHRSLTLSVVACFFGLCALAFILDHRYRLLHEGDSFLFGAGIAAAIGLLVDLVTLLALLRDDRNAYPSMRLSLATYLWALGCFPVGLLIFTVVGDVLERF